MTPLTTTLVAAAGTTVVVATVVGCTAGVMVNAGPSSITAPTTTVPTSTPTPTGPTPPAARLTVHTLSWRLRTPLAREAVATEDGSAVVAGGLVAGDVSTANAYRYNLSTGQATPLPDLPVAVHDAAGAILGSEPAVVAGGNATEQDVVQGLVTHHTWSPLGRLPQPRSDLAAVTDAGRIYVVGGTDGVTPALPDVLVTANGRNWTTFARLKVPVRYAATVTVGDAIWILGGERNGQLLDTIQRIDLRSGRVTVVGHLARPVGEACGVAFGHRILLIGGRTGPSTPTSAMWWFDPSSARVTRAGRLPMPLADSALVRDGGRAYLLGGETPSLSDRVVRIAYHG